ncbi:hypothetical protein EDB85DRAFT_1902851, partial [Lactarius pseudohatsudake]
LSDLKLRKEKRRRCFVHANPFRKYNDAFARTYGLSRCAGDALCREQKGEGPQAPGRGKAGPFVFNTIDRPDAAPECPGTPEAPLPMTSIPSLRLRGVAPLRESILCNTPVRLHLLRPEHQFRARSTEKEQALSTTFRPPVRCNGHLLHFRSWFTERCGHVQRFSPGPLFALGRLDNKEHDDVKVCKTFDFLQLSPNGRQSSSVELDVTLPENVEVCVLRSSVLKSSQASMDVCDPLDAGQREGEFESLAQHESEEDLTNVNEEPCLGGSASLASEERHEPPTTTTTTTSPAPAERSTNRRHHTNASTKHNGGGTPTTNLRQERWRGGAATQAATPRLDDDNGGNNGDNDSSDDGNDSSDDSNDSSDDGNNRNDNGDDGSDDGDDSDDATDGGGDAAKAGGDDDAAGFVVVFLQ